MCALPLFFMNKKGRNSMLSTCPNCKEELEHANIGTMTLKCHTCGSLEMVIDVDAKLSCPFCEESKNANTKHVFKNKKFSTVCGCFKSRAMGQSGVWNVRVLGRRGRGSGN